MKTTIDFDHVSLKLRAFSAASGAPMADIVRKAVEREIDKALCKNAGIRARYLRELEKLMPKGGNIIPLRRNK